MQGQSVKQTMRLKGWPLKYFSHCGNIARIDLKTGHGIGFKPFRFLPRLLTRHFLPLKTVLENKTQILFESELNARSEFAGYIDANHSKPLPFDQWLRFRAINDGFNLRVTNDIGNAWEVSTISLTYINLVRLK